MFLVFFYLIEYVESINIVLLKDLIKFSNDKLTWIYVLWADILISLWVTALFSLLITTSFNFGRLHMTKNLSFSFLHIYSFYFRYTSVLPASDFSLFFLSFFLRNWSPLFVGHVDCAPRGTGLELVRWNMFKPWKSENFIFKISFRDQQEGN